MRYNDSTAFARLQPTFQEIDIVRIAAHVDLLLMDTSDKPALYCSGVGAKTVRPDDFM